MISLSLLILINSSSENSPSGIINEFLLKKQEEYVSMFSPIFGIKYPRVRGLLYRLKIHKLLHSNTHLKLILNLIRCESHAEIVKHSIEKKINK